jgi:hypothetical protein
MSVVTQQYFQIVEEIDYMFRPVLRFSLRGVKTCPVQAPTGKEPEGSLPYSQVPATCAYPELTPSSPHDPRQLPQHNLNSILYTRLQVLRNAHGF